MSADRLVVSLLVSLLLALCTHSQLADGLIIHSPKSSSIHASRPSFFRRGKSQKLSDSSVSASEGLDVQVQKFDSWLFELGKKVKVFDYANLSEFKPFSVEGLLFLLTNVPFVLASQTIRNTHPGEMDLLSMAASLDISFVFSMLYHYAQMYYGPDRKEVRRFLFLDYISAFFTCLLVTIEVFPFLAQFQQANLGYDVTAIAPIFIGLSSIGCLGLSWKYEYGRSYLFWHGMWHLLSAYTTVLLANRMVLM